MPSCLALICAGGPPDHGAHVVVIEPNDTHGDTIRDHYPANSMQRYFSKKLEMIQQERETWEQIGDEDLIGNARWICGMRRIFWQGSLDSQGCPTASSVEVKEIFHHCILVSTSTILFFFPFGLVSRTYGYCHPVKEPSLYLQLIAIEHPDVAPSPI